MIRSAILLFRLSYTEYSHFCCFEWDLFSVAQSDTKVAQNLYNQQIILVKKLF